MPTLEVVRDDLDLKVMDKAVGKLIIIAIWAVNAQNYTEPINLKCCVLKIRIRSEFIKEVDFTIKPVLSVGHYYTMVMATLSIFFLCSKFLYELDWEYIYLYLLSMKV
jgi:hypothetical protein